MAISINTRNILSSFSPPSATTPSTHQSPSRWRPNRRWLVVLASVCILLVILGVSAPDTVSSHVERIGSRIWGPVRALARRWRGCVLPSQLTFHLFVTPVLILPVGACIGVARGWPSSCNDGHGRACIGARRATHDQEYVHAVRPIVATCLLVTRV